MYSAIRRLYCIMFIIHYRHGLNRKCCHCKGCFILCGCRFHSFYSKVMQNETRTFGLCDNCVKVLFLSFFEGWFYLWVELLCLPSRSSSLLLEAFILSGCWHLDAVLLQEGSIGTKSKGNKIRRILFYFYFPWDLRLFFSSWAQNRITTDEKWCYKETPVWQTPI